MQGHSKKWMNFWWYGGAAELGLVLLLGGLQYFGRFNTSYFFLAAWLLLLLWLLSGVLLTPWRQLLMAPAKPLPTPSFATYWVEHSAFAGKANETAELIPAWPILAAGESEEVSWFSWQGWKKAWRAWWHRDTAYLGYLDQGDSFPLLPRGSTWLWILGISVVYGLSHYIGVQYTSWNSFGLYDDAARDLIFLKELAFSDVWQSIYFTADGLISREFIFHYYIYFWFKLFGANLIVFNVALTSLGLATVIFCTLAVQELWHNHRLTLAANILMQIFPFLFTQEYVGHRYAITPPLLSAMLYFGILLYQRRQLCWAVLTGYAAALTVMASIMGRQILYAAILTVLLKLILAKGKLKTTPQNMILASGMVLGFSLMGLPTWLYIVTHWTEYWRRENQLGADFFKSFSGTFLVQRLKKVVEVLSSTHAENGPRWGGNYPPLGWGYYPLLLVGSWWMLCRRHFYLAILAVLPIGAAFIAGPYDFRMYLGVPAWLILMAVGLRWLQHRWHKRRHWHTLLAKIKLALALVVGGTLLWQLAYDVKFVYLLRHNPQHIYSLRHIEVANSRMERDLILGRTPSVKWHERDEFLNHPLPAWNAFPQLGICTHSTAVFKLYLPYAGFCQRFKFCAARGSSREEQLKVNQDYVLGVRPERELLLIWEEDPAYRLAIQYFRNLSRFGEFKTYVQDMDKVKVILHAMRIPAGNISALQDFIKQEREPKSLAPTVGPTPLPDPKIKKQRTPKQNKIKGQRKTRPKSKAK